MTHATDRAYRLYRCPECREGCELTQVLPGCGPRMDSDRRCPCGYKGAFVPFTAVERDRETLAAVGDGTRAEDALLALTGYHETAHGWMSPDGCRLDGGRAEALEEACATVEMAPPGVRSDISDRLAGEETGDARD